MTLCQKRLDSTSRMHMVLTVKSATSGAHYDATGFCQSATTALNGNILSRIRNALVEAINAQVVLQRAVILVLDNDLLNYFNHYKPGVSLLLGKAVEWIANQFHRIITAHKEKLPSKSRKFKYPTILWSKLPIHKEWTEINESRTKLNTCIKNTVSLFREMEILEFPEWNSNDSSIVTRSKLNAKGFIQYWQCINRGFEEWDKAQMKLKQAATVPFSSDGKKFGNKYRERTAESRKFDWKPIDTRFKLPKPLKF